MTALTPPMDEARAERKEKIHFSKLLTSFFYSLKREGSVQVLLFTVNIKVSVVAEDSVKNSRKT